MATTEAGICNLALLKLGEKQLLDDLNANTTAAKTCKALFDTARDFLLELSPWPFATRRADLAVLADSSDDAAARSGWQYTYALPADCIPNGWRYIWAGIRNPDPDQMIPFEVEDDATNGMVLITDMQQAELVYTRRVLEPAKMPASFQEALAWKLAYELTMAIPVKSQLGLAMMNGFKVALATAQGSAFNHQTPSPKQRPAAVRVR